MQAHDPLRLDPEDIETRGVVRKPSGAIVSRIGVLLSVYFLDGWKHEKREQLLLILQDYVSRFSDKVTHYQKDDARSLSRWDGEGLPGDYRSLADIGAHKQLSCHMQHVDPKGGDDPSLWRIMLRGFAKNNAARPLSGIKAHFPPTYVFADPERFVELVRTWCGRVDAIHGSAGLGVLTVPGRETTEEPYHYQLLRRYPALEYDAMGNYWSETRKGGYEQPRSSNWLTILGQQNVAALGGVQSIQSRLGPGMTLEHYETGVIIRAGVLPQLGDAATNTIPDAYQIAARIIKPMRYEGYKWGVIKVPDKSDWLEETLKWVRRFD
ncbi:type VI immunity family protein [Polyangium mundeleinium]|uniref:DUF3396 domain-containing protein n=1 Tax=Polyangium mundeleinium TaxID=2995306 RepID=A0ABT5F758_9BACT|nr:type VI immunity family protein [Polyangium mundeleinium]MDC0749942.1 DUF3396 domain-containing protein [Polyangium mundeleinium]